MREKREKREKTREKKTNVKQKAETGHALARSLSQRHCFQLTKQRASEYSPTRVLTELIALITQYSACSIAGFLAGSAPGRGAGFLACPTVKWGFGNRDWISSVAANDKRDMAG